jgi:hypothetical protein
MAFGAHIVYPIDSANYPVITPPSGGAIAAAFVTFSFSVTCSDNPVNVQWDIDGNQVGSATCYDQMSVQFVYDVAAGQHKFTVQSTCGADSVQFSVS